MLPLTFPEVTAAQPGDPDVGKAWTSFQAAWSTEIKTTAGAFAELVHAMADTTNAYVDTDMQGARIIDPGVGASGSKNPEGNNAAGAKNAAG
ncbi:hypothetical protein ACWEO2_41985 [Nocardia sp. NPDC004278]